MINHADKIQNQHWAFNFQPCICCNPRSSLSFFCTLTPNEETIHAVKGKEINETRIKNPLTHVCAIGWVCRGPQPLIHCSFCRYKYLLWSVVQRCLGKIRHFTSHLHTSPKWHSDSRRPWKLGSTSALRKACAAAAPSPIQTADNPLEYGDGEINPGTVPWTPSHSWVKMDVNNPLKYGIYRYWPIPIYWNILESLHLHCANRQSLEVLRDVKGKKSLLHKWLKRSVCTPFCKCPKTISF